MGSLKLTTASSGSVILSPANTASDVTITVPAVTGTMATIGPAFSAYASATQTLTGGANTKIQYNTEDFDTNNNYDNSTYRFTPTVAGYYMLNANIRPNATNGEAQITIYKNGSSIKAGTNVSVSLGSQYGTMVSSLVYANGSTDYFEIYCYVTNTSTSAAGTVTTWFNGIMVRAA